MEHTPVDLTDLQAPLFDAETAQPPPQRRTEGAASDARIPSADTTAPAQGTATLLQLAIEHLHPDPNAPRSAASHEGLNNLTDSVKRHGVLTPILVTPSNAGRTILAGHRRVEAARRAGLTHIPAIEIPTPDPATGLIETLHHEHLDPIDRVQAVLAHTAATLNVSEDEAERLIRKHRPTRGRRTTTQVTFDALCDLERQLNTTFHSFSTNHLALLKLDTTLKQAVRNHQLSASTALELNRITDPNERNPLLEQAIQGTLTRTQLRAHMHTLHTGQPSTAAAPHHLRMARRAIRHLQQAIEGLNLSDNLVDAPTRDLDQLAEDLDGALKRIRQWQAHATTSQGAVHAS